MKNCFLATLALCLLCTLPSALMAQQNVGIGTTTPNASAVLDLTSTTQGLLVPRMTTVQRVAIPLPATGLLVYDTNLNQFWYFNGSIWVQAIGPMGPAGPQGVQGPQGPVGASGVTGPSGADGMPGATGASGPTGDPGLQGVAGVTGPVGASGVTGPSGADGMPGATGASGPTGDPGLQGVAGVTGPGGAIGVTGPSGADGALGPQGLPGVAGPSGSDGAPGPIGLTGVTGPSGADGAPGIQGLTGPSGTDGAQGLQGPIGIQGVTGPTGAGGADAWALTGNAATVPGVGVGQNFIGTTDATDWIIASNATERIRVGSSGTIQITGDFVNQELRGNAIACTTNVASPVPGGPVTAVSLGLPTNIGGTTTRSTSQPLVVYNDVASACIIDGTTQSITITDGSGVNNSGVLVIGSVAVRTLTTAVLPNAMRFQIWLQRSTDNFVSDVVNVWRTESAIGFGLPVAAPYNPTSGNMTVPIVYPDLTLAPGTYTYRLVFQGGNYGTGGGAVNYEALDRSLVLLQVKR